ncbi:uncharacterized protein LOC131939353 [Physella acuta]|uniref:uncharacterized protein LOC131939353 n=1 Tax=Physella acuta TaxID=109671 RepID=UPI0027DB0078|nr:uncharacterized protein LOC131939353 [Physella acuta]
MPTFLLLACVVTVLHHFRSHVTASCHLVIAWNCNGTYVTSRPADDSCVACGRVRGLADGQLLVNLTGCGVTENDTLRVPDDTTWLVLDHNNIRHLRDNFLQLDTLRHLSIRQSHISTVQADALRGLKNLEVLDLEGNFIKVTCTSSLPPAVFRHVPRLKTLQLADNWNQGCSSDAAPRGAGGDMFHYLPRLESLSLDAPSGELRLGPEFRNLSHLSSLRLQCTHVTSTTNVSLQSLWDLPLINLTVYNFDQLAIDPEFVDPGKVTFHEDTFQRLDSLQNLVIANCKIGNQQIARTLKPFVNKRLTSLTLIETHYKRVFNTPPIIFQDGTITNVTTQFLRQIELSHLAWINSNLIAVAPGALISPQWKTSIRTLDFSQNDLGRVGWRIAILEISSLQKLQEVVMSSVTSSDDDVRPKLEGVSADDECDVLTSGDDIIKTNQRDLAQPVPAQRGRYATSHPPPPTSHPPPSVNQLVRAGGPHSDRRPVSESSPEIAWSADHSVKLPLVESSSGGNWSLRVPPRLQTFRIVGIMSGATRFGDQSARFTQAGDLKHMYIVNNYVISGTGRVLGLSALTLFDLSGTFMDVQHYFFDDFPGLRILRLKSMRPENFFSRLSCDRLIANLPHLAYLDLSNNRLNRLPAGVFQRNPRMTHVILAKNRFSCLPFDLNNTPDLEYLDLSENAVTYLEQDEMAALTAHWQQTPNFRLKLGGNNIACVCSQIRFLGWLEKSQFVIGRDLYTCTSQDGQQLMVSDVIDDLQSFYRHCNGSMYLMTSLVLLTFHLLTFLSAVLVLRFRTCLLAFIWRLLFPARLMTADDYKYDVFLGYADDDFLYVRRVLSGFLEDSLKVRTFIHQRDLGPGYTDQQFFKAIRNSWRVMLVVTDNFLHGYQLCDVIIKFASHSVTSLNPRRLLVLVEESQYQNIPDYLYDVIDETRIVVVKDLQGALGYDQQQKIKDCILS